VQRVTKWIRHLPDFGVTPVVLTAKNPSVPVQDRSLLADVAPDIQVERVPTLEPSYDAKRKIASHRPASPFTGALTSAVRALLFPDPQVLWLPAAIARLARLAREPRPFDVAVITAPPFSGFLLLPFIRRLMKVPVVLDYRDEWTTTLAAGHDHRASHFASRLSALLERWVVRRAAAITTATEEFREELLARFPELDAGRVVFLPNGYDAEDLPPRELAPDRVRFVMTYAGTVFRLTSLRGLIAALRLIEKRRPELLDDFELRVYGRVAPTEEDAFVGSESLGVRRFGYLDHSQVLDALAASHVNLCVLDDVEGAERVYPAKIFELMALRRPCLVLAPPGALARLARKHAAGDVVAPRDAESIAAVVTSYLEAWQKGEFPLRSRARDLSRFSRKALAAQLAGVLLRATGKGEPGERRVDLPREQRA
jgi:glycosyltransferase involved in cell wall biosynthesis